MNTASVVIALRDTSDLAAASEALAHGGYLVHETVEGRQALAFASHRDPSLVVIDKQLGDMSGIDVCSEIRGTGNSVPVLFLTDDARIESKLNAFRVGADDYVIQPAVPEERVARTGALLRRSSRNRDAEVLFCKVGRSTVDLKRGRAIHGLSPVTLTFKELELLRYLFERRGRIVSREQVLREVWRYESSGTRTVDVHLSTLRQKLEDSPRRPRHLITVRRQGYLFANRHTPPRLAFLPPHHVIAILISASRLRPVIQ